LPDLARYLTIVIRTPLDAAVVMPEIKNAIYGAVKYWTVYKARTIVRFAEGGRPIVSGRILTHPYQVTHQK
jgi:hypothetical protein